MRLFIAIDFSPRFKKKIVRSIQPLVSAFPQISWVKTDNLHLTLKFLGETKKLIKDEEAVEKIGKAIKQSCIQAQSFKLEFGNLGYFTREQLIIWLGIKDNSRLLDLVENIERACSKLGFAREKRAYSSHITLGRGKRLSSGLTLRIKKQIKNEPSLGLPSYPVKKLVLIKSKLTSSGPIYTPVSHFSLLVK